MLFRSATPAKQPVVKRNILNGKAVVRFDGAANYMQGPHAQAQPTTIFLVLKSFGNGSAVRVWFDGNVLGNRNLIYENASAQVDVYAGGTDQVYARAFPTPYVCFSVVFNGASSSVWENLTSQISGVNPGAGSLSGPTIGALFDGSADFAQIDVAEILIYYAALNNTDRTSVVNWLNGKYALF